MAVLKFFPSSKIDFGPIFKLQKMEFGQKKNRETDLYLISWVFFYFLSWTFLNDLAHCAIIRPTGSWWIFKNWNKISAYYCSGYCAHLYETGWIEEVGTFQFSSLWDVTLGKVLQVSRLPKVYTIYMLYSILKGWKIVYNLPGFDHQRFSKLGPLLLW